MEKLKCTLTIPGSGDGEGQGRLCACGDTFWWTLAAFYAYLCGSPRILKIRFLKKSYNCYTSICKHQKLSRNWTDCGTPFLLSWWRVNGETKPESNQLLVGKKRVRLWRSAEHGPVVCDQSRLAAAGHEGERC